jgi:hypothetical protein
MKCVAGLRTPLLFLLLFLLLVISPRCLSLLDITTYADAWQQSSRELLSTRYFPYELCVLDNPELYNVQESIHNQSRCSHLITVPLVNISRRCWLGSKQQLGHDGTCMDNAQGCSTLSSRIGFKKYWSNVSDSPKTHEVGFGDAVKDLYFDVISFTGDSMAVQLAQRFVCGAMRRNMSLVSEFHGDFFDMRSGGATAVFNAGHRDGKLFVTATRLTNGMGLSSIAGHKTPLRGIDQECGPPRSNVTCRAAFASMKIYRHTKNMIRQHRKWGNTLHVLVLPIIIKEVWEYEPFAQAIVEVARNLQAISSRILVLTPFAQHYPVHPRGLYNNFKWPEGGERVCGPRINSTGEHPDSFLMREALDRIDTNWTTYIGWFDIEPFSVPWFDLHPE